MAPGGDLADDARVVEVELLVVVAQEVQEILQRIGLVLKIELDAVQQLRRPTTRGRDRSRPLGVARVGAAWPRVGRNWTSSGCPRRQRTHTSPVGNPRHHCGLILSE